MKSTASHHGIALIFKMMIINQLEIYKKETPGTLP